MFNMQLVRTPSVENGSRVHHVWQQKAKFMLTRGSIPLVHITMGTLKGLLYRTFLELSI